MKTHKKNRLNESALYWASFNCFELRLSGACVMDCSHSGPCDSDVAHYAPEVAAQIEADNFPNKPTPDKIRAELKEYGAWDAEELADDEANFARLVWLAAGNIQEEAAPDCSEPVKTEGVK
jgi:hypothetical protein